MNKETTPFISPKTKSKLFYQKDNDTEVLVSSSGEKFNIKSSIPNLIFPEKLAEEDGKSKQFYDGRAQQYDETLHLTFFTHNESEEEVRNKFIDKLNIKKNSKILEVACGTGRDSVLIAKRLAKEGEIHLQDISEDMIKRCVKKLKGLNVNKSFCLSNALYLPYPDHYFDATYSFGAIGEFSDKKRALAEMVRVTKKGGKIVFGDESIPIWHRDTEFYKILVKTNPMFSADIPFEAIPVEARNVNIKWAIGGTFYIIDFEVGEGEPSGNFDFEIPGIRGGSYRTRYLGELEGVKPETKKLAWEAAKKKGISMHKWLDELVKKAAEKDLDL